MNKGAVWSAPVRNREAEDLLIKELTIDRVSARLLVNRGLTDPADALKFLEPQLSHLHDPFLLPDMDKAARRIVQAIDNREKIFIHGDYDVDGVTSTAVYVRTLNVMGANILYRVPHRKLDGYDLKIGAVKWAHEQEATLIITTDCGIQAREAVKYANELGITVIITDHHEPGPDLPPAYAVINPHRHDSTYPFMHLAGVGVAFKTMQAVMRLRDPENEHKYIENFLDLVACGTIADVMPLFDENRVFASYGLRLLARTRKVGLRTLLDSLRYDPTRPLGSEAINFGIAPRINAVGRLDDAAMALDLLLTRDEDEAVKIVTALNNFNAERQDEQRRIVQEAIQLLDGRDIEKIKVLVIASTGWNTGIVGIVASKLVERYYRPSIVIGVDDTQTRGKGSARSIPGFDLFSSIQACRDLLDTAGGHEMAAGLSLTMDRIDQFIEAINNYAESVMEPDILIPKLIFDGVVDPSYFNLRKLETLQKFEPYGQGNPEPCFVSRKVEICNLERIGKELTHLRMHIRGETGTPVRCMAWGRADFADVVGSGSHLDLLYSPQVHHYQGRRTMQLNIKDMRVNADDMITESPNITTVSL